MDFSDSPSEAAFRSEARAFLEAHAPDPKELYGEIAMGGSVMAEALRWQGVQADHGFAALTWPEVYGGRGLGPIEQIIWNQEQTRVGLGLSTFVVGIGMAGPTIIAHGTQEQKERFLAPTLRADTVWCQMFSEPGAGSDLAGVGARAVRDGDDWVVTGQKTWSSGAQHADHGILLVRTDPSLPKHEGITYLLCPMDADGIDVRPIRQMNDASHFCDVFLNEVRIPDANRLGPVGGGWGCAMTTLMNERMAIGGFESFRFEDLVALAREHPENVDDVTRDDLAQVYAWSKALELLNLQVITKLGRGQMPEAESSVMKLAIVRLLSKSSDLALRLLGPEGMLRPGTWQDQFLFAPALHIAGGTDEIQKNIAAERVLGLPREARADKGVPFEALPRSG